MKPSLPLVIDATMLTSFACPVRFYRSHVLCKGADTKSIPLIAGGAFAAAMEEYRIAFYLDNCKPAECLERATLAAMLRWGDNDPLPLDHKTKGETFDARTLPAIIEACRGYFERYPPQIDALQPKPSSVDGKVSFEHSFACPLEDNFPLHPSGEPFILAGRFDTRGTYNRVPVWADEKTTGQLGRKWASQWPLRLQFLAYGWALREMGQPERACLIRGVCIQKTKTTYVECLQHFPDALLDHFAATLSHNLSLMVAYWQQDYWRREFGEACNAYGGCHFSGACLAPNPSVEHYALELFPERKWDPLETHQRPQLLQNWNANNAQKETHRQPAYAEG